MAQVGANDLKQGMKVELQNNPFTILSVDLVKPGKGQAFTRTKLKGLLTGKVIEKTFKSNEKIDLADVVESKKRMLYTDQNSAVFMDDNSFEQVSIPLTLVGDEACWLMEDLLYDIIFYKGEAVSIIPPTFLEMTIAHTDPGVKGDTASGRVLKPATTDTGAKIQVPIFINEGEKVKVDTRSGEYVCRV